MSREKKPLVYHKSEGGTAQPCMYEVWSRERRKLVPCGKPGCLWVEGENRNGIHLCDEHGEFYADAKSFVKPVAD